MLKPQLYTRSAGILCHISSLPSAHGIGDLGVQSRIFVDFLSRAGISIWQILPLGPTGFANSPYQSFSSFAGNTYFIDIEHLHDIGLLKAEEIARFDDGISHNLEQVDYEYIYHHKPELLLSAAFRFLDIVESQKNSQSQPSPSNSGFLQNINALINYYTLFVKDNAWWLDDYCLFMSIKEAFGGISWNGWPRPLRIRDPKAIALFAQSHSRHIKALKALQAFFFFQWTSLKSYANSLNIDIMGDIPIYVAHDSVDVWANPQYFELNKNRKPTFVAGCPPDAFSELGQFWGNPLYRWDYHAKENYAWWIRRLKANLKLYDILRIDHFRGLESYWSIPAGDLDARGGRWEKGPGTAFVDAINTSLRYPRIVAEDLGYQSDEVMTLLKKSGYPGMKVLQFAFDLREKSSNLPDKLTPNTVYYTGTHDNQTVAGWKDEISKRELYYCHEYLAEYLALTLKINSQEFELLSFCEQFLHATWASDAVYAIAPLQDFLELGRHARMNTPSTTLGNWQWRTLPQTLTKELQTRILALNIRTQRKKEP